MLEQQLSPPSAPRPRRGRHQAPADEPKLRRSGASGWYPASQFVTPPPGRDGNQPLAYQDQDGEAPAPPSGRHRAPAETSRERRRIRVTIALLALAGTVSAATVASAAVLGWPVYRDSRADVAAGDRLADLDRVPDQYARHAWTADRLRMVADLDHQVAGTYRDPRSGEPAVAIAAARHVSWNPEATVNSAMTGMDSALEFNPGSLGGVVRCASARVDSAAGAYCVWADHGTVGAGFFPERSLPTAADLFVRMRKEITIR